MSKSSISCSPLILSVRRHNLPSHCQPAATQSRIGSFELPWNPNVSPTSQPSSFWINWLLVVAAGGVAFGLVLVLSPSISRQGFSLLVYASPAHIDTFGQEQVRYISLAHAVIGGVMLGWGVAIFYITKSLLARGERIAWNVVALSVGAWFVPDTLYSLISGYWQNAVLNTVFLALFALPLWATRGLARNDA